MLLHRLCSLGEAAVRRGPPTAQEHPMLDEQSQELGVHFTQETPRRGAPGRLDSARALPPCKEACDLPPPTPEDEGLLQRPAFGGHRGHAERPGRQRQPTGPDLVACVTGGLLEAPTAGIGDVLGHPHRPQTRGETRALTLRDGQRHGVRRRGLHELQETPAVPGGVGDCGLPLAP